jgi:uncharacterized protein YndB with AHSA1/START domain
VSNIRQEVVFKASPKQVYEALTDAQQFSKVTGGAPTQIASEAGGAFSCFGGMILGRQLELVPHQRIVQAWRAGNWAPGAYSIATFDLKAQGGGTRLVFEHAAFPEDQKQHLEEGWSANYWEPLQKFLARDGA